MQFSSCGSGLARETSSALFRSQKVRRLGRCGPEGGGLQSSHAHENKHGLAVVLPGQVVAPRSAEDGGHQCGRSGTDGDSGNRGACLHYWIR